MLLKLHKNPVLLSFKSFNYFFHKRLASPRPKIPPWLKTDTPKGKKYFQIKDQLKDLGLSTVCQEAKCPNIGECWNDENGAATATIMIMGSECTRACRFCSVKTSSSPNALDPNEPIKTAKAIASWDVDYVVITSVDRDDIEDGGAAHFSETIELTKKLKKSIKLEVLIPDFSGNLECLKKVVHSQPDVIAHNVETVRRLQKSVRDRRASYDTSLYVLDKIKDLDKKMWTKTSLMLGLGETDTEIEECMHDLRKNRVDCLTLGQYMQPTRGHLPVIEYLTPQKFEGYKKLADSLGFKYVASGPLVRSSYKAGEYFMKNLIGGK